MSAGSGGVTGVRSCRVAGSVASWYSGVGPFRGMAVANSVGLSVVGTASVSSEDWGYSGGHACVPSSAGASGGPMIHLVTTADVSSSGCGVWLSSVGVHSVSMSAGGSAVARSGRRVGCGSCVSVRLTDGD